MRRKRSRKKVVSAPKLRGQLGGYVNNRIWVSKAVPKKLRKRIHKHERTELNLRKKGYSYKKAHKIALKAEHKGLTKKGIARYEGKLGAISKKLGKRR